MKYLLSAVVIVFFVLASNASAEVKIYAVEIPGLFQKDGGGIYDKIVEEQVVSKGLASIKVSPPGRTEHDFASCDNCCLAPANLNPDFYHFEGGAVATKPMSTAKLYIFTGKGTKPISSLDTLKGKKIGVRQGMPYGKKIDNAGLKTEAVTDIKFNIKKLDAGRIDAFIAYVPDAYTAFEEMGVDLYPHDEANPIAVYPESLVCRGVSADFLESFNSGL